MVRDGHDTDETLYLARMQLSNCSRLVSILAYNCCLHRTTTLSKPNEGTESKTNIPQ
jgi:hypothetical protein